MALTPSGLAAALALVVLLLPPLSSCSSAYFSPAYPAAFDEAVAALTLQGIVNREVPRLWLNSSSNGFAPVPIMWFFPPADVHWREYLASSKGVTLADLPASDICTLLSLFPGEIEGLVVYDYPAGSDAQGSPSSGQQAAQLLAVTWAGLLDALPVHAGLVARFPCLSALPVLQTVANFSTFQEAYAWGIEALLPLTNTSLVCSACVHLDNYTCGWADPVGAASIDFAVSRRAFVFSVSPDSVSYPDQAELFGEIVSHLDPLGFLVGWAESEPGMVAQLSKVGGTVLCGAPNLSFWSSPGLASSPKRLPYNRKVLELRTNMYYIILQTNEGDTAKDAYSLRGGQWLQRSANSTVPIAWGVNPLLARYATGLWNYYVETALPSDTFFAATAGAGYTYPWMLPGAEGLLYFQRAGELVGEYLPTNNTLVDVWEGGLNKTGYERYRAVGNSTISAFSQQPNAGAPAVNAWLNDSTPLFLADSRLWYPSESACNQNTTAARCDCLHALVLDVASKNSPPYFILIYGMEEYVAAASYLQVNLDPSTFQIVGAQDLADLGRQAGQHFFVPQMGV